MLDKVKKKISRILEHERWCTAASIAASMCNKESFSELKNLYCGKEVVICGAGPSLSKYQPIQGAVHIALNRALLFDKVKFDYFFADDWVGINFFTDYLLQYDCKKYMGYHCGMLSERDIPESFRLKCNAKKYYTDSYVFPGQENSHMVLDIDKMPISNTYNMGMQVFQIALFMNPSKLYLVGIDASSNGHFGEKDHEGKNKKLIKDDLKKYVDFESVKSRWEEIKRFVEIYYPDTEVISINPVGLKGLFNDYYQENE